MANGVEARDHVILEPEIAVVVEQLLDQRHADQQRPHRAVLADMAKH